MDIFFTLFKLVFDREDILAVQGITLMMVRELSFSKNLYFAMK